MGGFPSEDPIPCLGGNNFYAYGDNNPGNKVDRWGLQASGGCCTWANCFEKCVNTLLIHPGAWVVGLATSGFLHGLASNPHSTWLGSSQGQWQGGQAAKAIAQGLGIGGSARLWIIRGGVAAGGGAAGVAGAAASGWVLGVLAGCSAVCTGDPCWY